MPSGLERAYDAVVVGAGVIGLTTAWRLAGSGGAAGPGGRTGPARRVAVVDPRPGRGSSYAAAGMLAPVTEVHYGEEGLLEINLRSARTWPAFAAELEAASGMDPGYVASGTLLVALDAGDRAVLEELYGFQASLGLPVEWCAPSRCREIEPLLAPGIRGGILAAQDNQVDNRRLLACLALACERAGVEHLAETVEAVTTSAGAVTGLETPSGRLEAPTVVLAAGWATGSIGGLGPSVVPDVRPVKGQILRLRARSDGPGAPAGAARARAPRLGRIVRGVVQGSTVYVVPRADGGAVLGATMEEVGADLTVTVEACHQLLRNGVRVLPFLGDHELLETLAALRPGSPDNVPLVGPTGVPGLVLATGHYRNGVLLAPLTGDAVLELCDSGSLPDWAAPMHPGRFGAGPPAVPAPGPAADAAAGPVGAAR